MITNRASLQKVCQIVLIAIVQIFASGCASVAWKKYPIKTQPDYVCRIGGPESAALYYVWKCLDQKRIVITQGSFWFWQSSAKKYESACESITEIENSKNLSSDQKYCHSDKRWKTD